MQNKLNLHAMPGCSNLKCIQVISQREMLLLITIYLALQYAK